MLCFRKIYCSITEKKKLYSNFSSCPCYFEKETLELQYMDIKELQNVTFCLTSRKKMQRQLIYFYNNKTMNVLPPPNKNLVH